MSRIHSTIQLAFAVAGLEMAGCATTGTSIATKPSETARTAENRPQKDELGLSLQAAPVDPQSIANAAITPEECVRSASDAKQRSADAGWAVLKACINRGKYDRMRYFNLPTILNGTWDSDLARRPDAPAVIANLIARRGGDVMSDLAQFQKARVPIFLLGTAMEQPDVYRNRLVLVHARLETRKEGKKVQTQLAEFGLGAEGKEYEVPGVRHKWTRKASGTVQANAETAYNNDRGSARVSGKYEGEVSETWKATQVRYDNTFKPTGARAIAKFVNQDPFMLPGKQYVFLARFDGVSEVKVTEDEYDQRSDTFANVTVLQHFPLSANTQE